MLIGPVPVLLPSRFVISDWAGLQLLYTAVVLRRAQYGGAVAVSYEVHTVGFLVGLIVIAAAVALHPELRLWRPQARPDDNQAPDLSTGDPGPGRRDEAS